MGRTPGWACMNNRTPGRGGGGGGAGSAALGLGAAVQAQHRRGMGRVWRVAVPAWASGTGARSTRRTRARGRHHETPAALTDPGFTRALLRSQTPLHCRSKSREPHRSGVRQRQQRGERGGGIGGGPPRRAREARRVAAGAQPRSARSGPRRPPRHRGGGGPARNVLRQGGRCTPAPAHDVRSHRRQRGHGRHPGATLCG